MSNIKNLKPLSDWLEYELETDILDPPKLRIKMRPLSALAGLNIEPGDLLRSSALVETVIDAIQEWDLADDNTPIPCNADAKREFAVFLRVLLGERIKGGSLLGIELVSFAGNPENFLKN